MIVAHAAVAAISTPLIITIVFAVVLIGAAVTLFIVGRKLQRKQEDSRTQMEANKQTVTGLIIDKKRLRANEAKLPQVVYEQIPKLMRRSKLPIVKAKIGTQMLSLIADEKIFDLIPVKKEVKLTISGIYIMNVKAAHGSLPAPPKKKRSKFSAWVERMQEKAGAKPIK